MTVGFTSPVRSATQERLSHSSASPSSPTRRPSHLRLAKERTRSRQSTTTEDTVSATKRRQSPDELRASTRGVGTRRGGQRSSSPRGVARASLGSRRVRSVSVSSQGLAHSAACALGCVAAAHTRWGARAWTAILNEQHRGCPQTHLKQATDDSANLPHPQLRCRTVSPPRHPPREERYRPTSRATPRQPLHARLPTLRQEEMHQAARATIPRPNQTTPMVTPTTPTLRPSRSRISDPLSPHRSLPHSRRGHSMHPEAA